MIFKASITPLQKEELKYKSNSKKLKYYLNWHRIFAFVPHQTTEGHWVWLETMERLYLESYISYGKVCRRSPVYRILSSQNRNDWWTYYL